MKAKELFGLTVIWVAFLGAALYEGHASLLVVTGVGPLVVITFVFGYNVGRRSR